MNNYKCIEITLLLHAMIPKNFPPELLQIVVEYVRVRDFSGLNTSEIVTFLTTKNAHGSECININFTDILFELDVECVCNDECTCEQWCNCSRECICDGKCECDDKCICDPHCFCSDYCKCEDNDELIISGVEFTGVKFYECTMYKCVFDKCIFNDVAFTNSTVKGAVFNGCLFNDTEFCGTGLEDMSMKFCRGTGLTLNHCDTQLDIYASRVSKIAVHNCEIGGSSIDIDSSTSTTFTKCSLSAVTFRGICCSIDGVDVSFDACRFERCNIPMKKCSIIDCV